MKKRLLLIDYFRVIGLLGVVAIHVSSKSILTSNISYIINQASRFAVPLFIFVSGMSMHINNNKKVNLLRYYFSRFKSIVIPFLIWTLIYILYDYRHSLGELFSSGQIIDEFSKSVLLGRGHLYFVIIIVQFYLFKPLLVKLYRLNGKVMVTLSFIISLTIQAIMYLPSWNIYILPYKTMAYMYLIFIAWIFYYMLGMYFADNLQNIKDYLQKYRKLVAIGFYISFMLLLADSKITTTYGSSVKPTVIIYCFFTIIFITSIVKERENKISDLIIYLSNKSFFIYLAHILVMNLNDTILYIIKTQLPPFSYYVFLLINTVIVAEILEFLPFTYLLGIKKGKNRKLKSLVAKL